MKAINIPRNRMCATSPQTACFVIKNPSSVIFPFRWIHVPFGMLYSVICHTLHSQLLVIYILACLRVSPWYIEAEKKRKAGHLEEVSFFIILKLCIWSFKNSVNPAVRTKKKVLLGLLQSLMSSWSLVTNLSSLHTSHSQEVKHGALWGNIYWPLAITANSWCARTKGGKKLSTSIQGDVCLCRG